jgi:PAS domain S-box-containing protein
MSMCRRREFTIGGGVGPRMVRPLRWHTQHTGSATTSQTGHEVAFSARYVNPLTRREAPMPGQDMGEDDARQMLEDLNEALYLIDANGHIQFCNAALGQLTGYPAEALLGHPSLDLYAPEDRPVVLERRTRAFQDAPVPRVLEATLLRHDGARVPVELSVTSLRRGARVVRRVAVVRDISARKQAETALRASEERFRLLVDTVQDYAIYLLDPDGRIATWNTGAARIKGYTAAEVLGRPFSRFFPPEERSRGTPARLLAQAARDGHYVGEGWRVRKDGSRFWASVVITALYEADGRLRGFAKVTRDITERRAAEQALAAANAQLEYRVAARTAELQALNTRLQASLDEREVLLKEIHHRVKNNLQVVLSLLALHRDTMNDPRTLQFLQESERRIQAMALVHETLYETSDLGHVNLGLYIPTLSAQLRRAYAVETDRVAVHMQVADVKLPIETAVPCGLILSELLSNCFKHAFPAGQTGDVTVTLTPEADHIRLCVRDTGCGVPADLDVANTASLGFQLVGALTDQLQGTLKLDRVGGSAVTLTFPFPDRPEHEAPSAGRP